MPTLTEIPLGCAFHPRCDRKVAICEKEEPPLVNVDSSGRMVACHMIGK